MARIYVDSWVEEHECLGIDFTAYLNGEMFPSAKWVDFDAGEIGSLVLDKDGSVVYDEETGDEVLAIVCGDVTLIPPDKSSPAWRRSRGLE